MTDIQQSGGDMQESQPAPKANGTIDRRALLRGGAALAVGAAASGVLLSRGGAAHAGVPRAAKAAFRAPYPGNTEQVLHLAATDGWVSMPGDAPAIGKFWPDPYAPDGFNTYVFGFRNVTDLDDSPYKSELTPRIFQEKNHAQISAPILGFDQYQYDAGTKTDNAVRITLSNLGLAQRPDLVDGHTIHWHGFTNAIPLFDGVPELSISVPIGRSFTYYYRPHEPGTYMYHCHFEDVEHVQMGMTGMVYVRPSRNVPASGTTPGQKFAYDHDETAYDREYTFMLTELWAEAHWRDAHIQTTDWTNFKPSFWLMNGRAYPDTLRETTNPITDVAPMSDSGMNLRYNPISSLVKAMEGEKVLLRLSSLGYQHHAITLDGIPMRIVAKDASCLIFSDHDLSYLDNTAEIGPGESRDAIFTAPAFSGNSGTSGKGYDVYRLYDRNYAYLSNAGADGYGGQMTEVRVYPTSANLPAQTKPNE